LLFDKSITTNAVQGIYLTWSRGRSFNNTFRLRLPDNVGCNLAHGSCVLSDKAVARANSGICYGNGKSYSANKNSCLKNKIANSFFIL
jgi:hypothetical protein